MIIEIKNLYNLLQYIIPSAIMLNIIGNTIKITFKIDSKYIIWILFFLSIIIYFVFLNISFESLFISIVTFSFSISFYDLLKQTKRIYREK